MGISRSFGVRGVLNIRHLNIRESLTGISGRSRCRMFRTRGNLGAVRERDLETPRSPSTMSRARRKTPSLHMEERAIIRTWDHRGEEARVSKHYALAMDFKIGRASCRERVEIRER